MPGAHFLDAARGTVMSRWDIVCIHTIVGYAPANAAHFSTRADGYRWQSRDTRYRSAANLNGNHRVIAIENEDHGPAYGAWSGSNVPFLTAAQVEANAQICAWAHLVHGIPLVACPNSLPGSRGVAYHRQGIDGNFAGYAYPGRAPGGELWSSAFGKVCAGDRRISQLTQIIHRARQIAGLEDDMTPEELLDYKISRQGSVLGGTTSLRAVVANFDQAAEGDAKRDAALLAAASKVDAVGAKVDAVAAGIPAAVQRGLADYLTANPPTVKVDIDYERLAKAMNDNADARRRDGDPTTGPTS
jgi:hypothetical protein